MELAVTVDVDEQVGLELEPRSVGGERGGSVAAVLLGDDDVQAGKGGRELVEDLCSGIGRSIVDDDDVDSFGERGEAGVQLSQEFGYAVGFVVRRHDHGEVIQAHAVSQAADVQRLHDSGSSVVEMTQRARWRQIAGLGARFLTVGAISTLIEIAVFNLLYLVFGWDPVGAKIVASLVALVNAYFGNREWTFRHRDRRGRTQEIVLFVLVNAACTALGALIVWAGVAAAGVVLGREIGPFIVNAVNLVSIVIVVLVRFWLYHSIVFRTAPTKTS